ncbi:hypothetical protein F6R98_14765 [Candidatus Methylospira mobilis]|uniref:Uncharacterized protein n=1 Tax=Candidatus Methylospira mobilis TaxID=1808979 RepID=A0A5Q0BKR6_9GAMM|nr:hypothetical protein [Candidatus Methylospira mobilis]QFY43732.1 hypothetical protein F6R98_14765 [Candidatus Methylospira mobilis]
MDKSNYRFGMRPDNLYHHQQTETDMKIDMYVCTNNSNKYLSVPAGTKVEDLEWPESTDPDIFSVSPFRSGIELDPDKPLFGLDQKNMIKQIESKGYAIHGSRVDYTISAASKI